MDKKPLIVVSICAVVLLVMGSLSTVVGYQSVQTSQQNIIKERINQRELLFQTIVDIANNKEIQRIILKSQMSRGIFPTAEIPVLTKNQLRQMYFLGLILSKFISKSKIQSIAQQYQLLNPNIQEEINAIMENDKKINSEKTQLKDSECDCEKDSSNDYPIICGMLWILFFICCVILLPFHVIYDLFTGIFYGTFLESLVNSLLNFYILIVYIILFPIPLLGFISVELIISYDCWDWLPGLP
jgi:hypothetical protein